MASAEMRTTAKDIQARVRDIIATGSIAHQQSFLMDLLSHRDKRLLTPGVVFERIVAGEEKKDALFAVTGDGDLISFSWLKCAIRWARELRDVPPDIGLKRTGVISALRSEIRHQTHGFRVAQGYVHMGGSYHVGHDWESGPAFIEIAEQFVRQRCGGDWDSVGLVTKRLGSHDKHLSKTLADRDLAAEWHAWHGEQARLRMETASDNLRGARGSPIVLARGQMAKDEQSMAEQRCGLTSFAFIL
jgi:hypothetical protein